MILERVRFLSGLVGRAERAAGRRLNVPAIQLPVELLGALAAAGDPALGPQAAPPPDAPARPPVHGLKALVSALHT